MKIGLTALNWKVSEENINEMGFRLEIQWIAQ